MWICPPGRSSDTFLRVSPISASCFGVVADVPSSFLDIGSQADAVTVLTCCTPVTRGWKAAIVSGHSTAIVVIVDGFPASTKSTLPPSVRTQKLRLRACRQMNSQSVSLSCWSHSCCGPVAVELAGAEPVLLQDLLDGVADGLLLEHAHLAVAHQLVAAVERADAEGDAAVSEVGVDGDDVAVEHGLRRCLGVDGADLEEDLRADLERLPVDVLHCIDLVVRVDEQREVAAVREHQAVDDLDLADPVRVLGVELGAVDPELVAGDVLLGGGGGGAHASSLGIVSGVPRLRCIGLSMPLASAIRRQRVGSP